MSELNFNYLILTLTVLSLKFYGYTFLINYFMAPEFLIKNNLISFLLLFDVFYFNLDLDFFKKITLLVLFFIIIDWLANFDLRKEILRINFLILLLNYWSFLGKLTGISIFIAILFSVWYSYLGFFFLEKFLTNYLQIPLAINDYLVKLYLFSFKVLILVENYFSKFYSSFLIRIFLSSSIWLLIFFFKSIFAFVIILLILNFFLVINFMYINLLKNPIEILRLYYGLSEKQLRNFNRDFLFLVEKEKNHKLKSRGEFIIYIIHNFLDHAILAKKIFSEGFLKDPKLFELADESELEERTQFFLGLTNSIEAGEPDLLKHQLIKKAVNLYNIRKNYNSDSTEIIPYFVDSFIQNNFILYNTNYANSLF